MEDNILSLINSIKLKYVVGESFINFYFEPASEKVDKTVIEIYSMKAGDKSLYGKYNISKLVNHKLITDLCDGVYEYQLSQYDEDGNFVVSIKPVCFTISSIRYGGIPMVFINYTE